MFSNKKQKQKYKTILPSQRLYFSVKVIQSKYNRIQSKYNRQLLVQFNSEEGSQAHITKFIAAKCAQVFFLT